MEITSGVTGQIYEVYSTVDVVVLPAAALGITALYIQNNISVINDGILPVKYNGGTVINMASLSGAYFVYHQDGDFWSFDTASGMIVYAAGLPKAVYEIIVFAYLDDKHRGEAGKRCWIGFFDYDGDQFCAIDNVTYMMKDATTFLLTEDATSIVADKHKLNGEKMEHYVLAAAAGGPAQKEDKEFVYITALSSFKPDKIEIYDSLENFRAGIIASVMDLATFGANYLKDYNGFGQLIPRHKDAPKKRQQGRIVFFCIRDTSHNDQEFLVREAVVEFRKLK